MRTETNQQLTMTMMQRFLKMTVFDTTECILGLLFSFCSPGSLVSVLTTLAVKHSKGTKYLKGDATELHGLLDYLRCHDKRLASPEFTGK